MFQEVREHRGLAYSVYSFASHHADAGVVGVSVGCLPGKYDAVLETVRGELAKVAADGLTEEEVERARAYAAGRRVLAFENTNAVARHAAYESIVFGEEIDPDAAIARLDQVTYDQVAEVARGISEELAVACVGPHDEEEFAPRA